MTASAVVLAAGRGERMRADVRKAFLELAGRPLFLHSVEAFARVAGVSELVVVVHRDDVDAAGRAVSAVAPDARIVVGGATRCESSLAGVRAAREEYVVIHDGCRPFAGAALIERVLDAAERVGAAVPILPSSDTLYRLERDGRRIEAVLDRASIARAQTPQGFLRSLILRCLEAADPAITDDASAVIAAGAAVTVVEGDPSNLKVTVPQDLRRAEAFRGRDG